ncbi:hypothetical protein ACLOJK_000693 [Asimina triloba]
MGASLCCLGGSAPAQEGGADHYEGIKRKELQQEEERVRKIAEGVTLEEWLSSSPTILARGSDGTATRRTNGKEIPLVKQSPTKVMIPWVMSSSPLAAEGGAGGQQVSFFALARDSFSLEMPKKSEEAGGAQKEPSQMMRISPISTTGEMMKKKKVSFRLPEEADIIIFWSPVKDIVADQ